MNDLIGKEIRNIYCNLFNLSTDLKDTIPQLEKIEKMAVLRNDPETSDVCNIAIDCVRDKMKFLSSGIRINGHRLKEMVD